MTSSTRWQVGVLAFGTILFSAVFLFTDGLLVSLILALAINYLFSPVVDSLERSGVPRTYATVIPFLVGLLALTIGFTLVLPLAVEQVKELTQTLPQLKQRWAETFVMVEGSIETNIGLSKSLGLFDRINEWLMTQLNAVSEKLPTAVSQSLTVLLLSPFFAFFILADGNRFGRSLLRLVPNRHFETALKLRHQLNQQLGGFVRARLIESAIVGLIIWIGLSMVGFPYTVILAIASAVANLIPYVGPIIGAVPALAISLFSAEASAIHGVSSTFGLVGLVYLIAQVVDTVFVIPLLVARIVNLHPVTVVLAILVGAEAYGILGMVVAIPVASAIKLILLAIVPLTNGPRIH